MSEDFVIEVADKLLDKVETFREAMLLNEELYKQVASEIKLRALEREVRKDHVNE